MRIISGKLKGRRFYVPTDLSVRPTTDQAKEALFNILNHRVCFQNIRILDLFCGLGGISYEFASRGAISIDCVDISCQCVRYLQEMIQRFQVTQQIRVIRADVFGFLQKNLTSRYDLIFADPPYRILYESLNPLIELSLQPQWLRPGGQMILEHSYRQGTFHHHPCYKETKRYGQACFSFFESLSLLR